LLDRGLARARAGDNAGALADLDQAVRLAPRSARVHYERGRVLRALGNERRAKADFARAAELDPAFGDGED
jgi:Flp pilus assembly protein TadD